MQYYRNGRIFTADAERPWASSLVVSGERLAVVGSDEEAARRVAASSVPVEVIDLAGVLVLPGFVDAHTHVIKLGMSLRQLQLVDASSLTEIVDRVRAADAADPDAPRILGGGWLYSALDGCEPTRDLLDAAVPDRPVYLSANDNHSAWVNSAALAELGIDADTPDPIGGRIERDLGTGEATGILTEMAALGLMADFLESTTTDADRDVALSAAIDSYLADGVTGIVDMGLDASYLDAIERAEAAGTLRIRVAGHWLVSRTATEAENLAQVRTAVDQARRLDGAWLRVAGIKIMCDGVIDSCTAAMRAPFADGTHPEPIWDRESLTPVVVAADAAGLQIAIHAIGDEASAVALDALEAAITVNGPRDRRHRLEHLETVTPDNLARLARLGVIASMQPVHADPAIQDNWRAMLGDARVERGYPWPEVTDAGGVLAFGTDAPTAPHRPLANLFVATTRRSALDLSLPPNLPDYALPLAEALAHGTRDAAYACRWEGLTGRLAPGLAADFVVLDTDLFERGPEALLDARVLRTVVGGIERYSRA